MNDKHYQWTPEEQVLLMKRIIALENELEVTRHAYIAMEERVGGLEYKTDKLKGTVQILENSLSGDVSDLRTDLNEVMVSEYGTGRHDNKETLLDKIKGIFN